MEKTVAQLQEELDRERVFSKLSNKKILELLTKQKEIQETCDQQIEALEQSHKEELASLKVAVTQAVEEALAKKEAEHQRKLEAQSQDCDKKIQQIQGQQNKLLQDQESRLQDKLLAQESYFKEKLYKLEMATKPVKNQRGAGRKRVANQETVDLVLKLRETGVSYVKISEVLKERLGVELGRTTVGEIVRGSYSLEEDALSL